MSWPRTTVEALTLNRAHLTVDQVEGGEDALRRIVGMVHAEEWKRILAARPTVRVAERSVTLDADRRVAISDLSATGERFHRVLAVGESLHGAEERERARRVLREGDSLYIPDGTASGSETVWVNHTPTRADDLATSDDLVVFPEDYELVVCYEAAAFLLADAGKDSGAANDLRQLAEEKRFGMLADLSRVAEGTPLRFEPVDDVADWGGF